MPSRYYGANATLSNVSTTSFSQTPIKNSNNEANKTMNINEKKSIKKTSSPENEPQVKQSAITNKVKAPVSKLSLLAIALTIGLTGLMCYEGHRQIENQKQTISSLQTEVANLKQNNQASVVSGLENKINEAVNKQKQDFSLLTQSIDRQLSDNQKAQQQLSHQIENITTRNEQNLNTINARLSALDSPNNNDWLIAQANYLVNLAGRKIWNDQDYTTASLLLKSADESLVEVNDPNLLKVRQAINKDINSLSNVTSIDTDGIILKLLGLTESLTELPLVGNYKDIDLGMNQYDDTIANDEQSNQSSLAANNSEISNSTDNWSDNLLANAKIFMDKFIKIEKLATKDNYFSECLDKAGDDEKQIVKCQILKTPLSAEQSFYLRENIRFRLLIAAQAVPRHQELIYQRALNDASIWVNAYFDGNAPAVIAFQNELENLQSQPITNQNIPDKLDSISELEKLMQTRVKSLSGK